jgi:putative Mn2+ efflux pump MntP
MLKLLVFILPLGLDSFAVATAIGTAQATASQRLRISLILVIFEGGMPLIGLGLGSVLAHGIGVAAGYLAAIIVSGIGAWMLLSDEQDEEVKASRITASRGLALMGLGIGISVDELAIGFSIGLTRLPVTSVTSVIAAIALQAFTAAQLGLITGAKVAERWRERTERLAGITLIVLGAYLIAEQLTR